jgi:hypothetical protein
MSLLSIIDAQAAELAGFSQEGFKTQSRFDDELVWKTPVDVLDDDKRESMRKSRKATRRDKARKQRERRRAAGLPDMAPPVVEDAGVTLFGVPVLYLGVGAGVLAALSAAAYMVTK